VVAETEKRREEEEEVEEQRGKKAAGVWRRRGKEMERCLGVKRRGDKWKWWRARRERWRERVAIFWGFNLWCCGKI